MITESTDAIAVIKAQLRLSEFKRRESEREAKKEIEALKNRIIELEDLRTL